MMDSEGFPDRVKEREDALKALDDDEDEDDPEEEDWD